MPVNAEGRKRVARLHIHKILTIGLKEIELININQLVKTTCLEYDISLSAARNYILQFYVETGDVLLDEDGNLSLPKK